MGAPETLSCVCGKRKTAGAAGGLSGVSCVLLAYAFASPAAVWGKDQKKAKK
jgi:hypothetical protein